jgi:tetratricopeptide (TPR) repeat protein
MENKELEKHIDELKILIEKGQYEEAVDYFVDTIYSRKSKEEKVLLEEFLLEYTDKLVLQNSPESLLLIGMIYVNVENYDEALKLIDKAIELNPEYAKAYNYRGNVYSDIKNYDKAFEDYDKAIELNPKVEYSYYNRGLLFNL